MRIPIVIYYIGVKFQFKCVIMDGQQLKRWEVLPNDLNRRYKAKYQQATLKGTENKVEGSEIVEKDENDLKKYIVKSGSEKKEKKTEKVQSIEFNGFFKITPIFTKNFKTHRKNHRQKKEPRRSF